MVTNAIIPVVLKFKSKDGRAVCVEKFGSVNVATAAAGLVFTLVFVAFHYTVGSLLPPAAPWPFLAGAIVLGPVVLIGGVVTSFRARARRH